jgi:hypothetical protein
LETLNTNINRVRDACRQREKSQINPMVDWRRLDVCNKIVVAPSCPLIGKAESSKKYNKIG